ncbi:ABC transporter permease [Labrys monachus]|uniref:Polar amino acid transport system permease protein n=1 Tax=Labrys monachus TaxID=217067 RepID=A0ABU0FI82_9HYPH|nr:ABC transporter permease subunit [Labrys monachus]MDQ0394318.1 polar amino acid transport system permease protein [Labrys monachus]
MDQFLSLLQWGDKGWSDEIFRGACLTLALAVCTLPFGLLIGLVMALARASGNWLAGAASNLYTTLFRSLPELLTILIVYYGGQSLLNRLLTPVLGENPNVQVNSFVAGMVALGLVLGAFSGEVWLGALRAIPRGQRESAYALGLSRAKCFRLVVFPQLVRLALPGLGNNWMILLKDTSLVSVIALRDLMYISKTAVIANPSYSFQFYLLCCVVYLLMALASGQAIKWLEMRGDRGLVRARA